MQWGLSIIVIMIDVLVSLGSGHVKSIFRDGRLWRQTIREMIRFPGYTLGIVSPTLRLTGLGLVVSWILMVILSISETKQALPEVPVASFILTAISMIAIPTLVVLWVLWCIVLLRCIGILLFCREVGAALARGVLGLIVGLVLSFGLVFVVRNAILLVDGMSPIWPLQDPVLLLFAVIVSPGLPMPAVTWLIDRLDGPILKAKYPRYRELLV